MPALRRVAARRAVGAWAFIRGTARRATPDATARRPAGPTRPPRRVELTAPGRLLEPSPGRHARPRRPRPAGTAVLVDAVPPPTGWCSSSTCERRCAAAAPGRRSPCSPRPPARRSRVLDAAPARRRTAGPRMRPSRRLAAPGFDIDAGAGAASPTAPPLPGAAGGRAVRRGSAAEAAIGGDGRGYAARSTGDALAGAARPEDSCAPAGGELRLDSRPPTTPCWRQELGSGPRLPGAGCSNRDCTRCPCGPPRLLDAAARDVIGAVFAEVVDGRPTSRCSPASPRRLGARARPRRPHAAGHRDRRGRRGHRRRARRLSATGARRRRPVLPPLALAVHGSCYLMWQPSAASPDGQRLPALAAAARCGRSRRDSVDREPRPSASPTLREALAAHRRRRGRPWRERACALMARWSYGGAAGRTGRDARRSTRCRRPTVRG